MSNQNAGSAVAKIDRRKARTPNKEKTVAQHPKNYDIPHQMVQVVDDNGRLHDPQQLVPILDSVNFETHVVRLVRHDPPIVRILTRLEDKMNQLTKKAEKKVQGVQRVDNMTIQLSWLTADADYDYKMSRAKAELEKGGIRVEIVFKNKPRVRYPSVPEMGKQMEEVAAALADLGTEWKERAIERGRAYMYFQSKVMKKARKALPTQEQIETKAREALELAERQAQLQKRSQKATGTSPQKLWR